MRQRLVQAIDEIEFGSDQPLGARLGLLMMYSVEPT